MGIPENRPRNGKPGVLLVGHGTRQLAGVVEFERLAAMVKRLLAPTPVAFGFLEHAEPSINDAVAEIAKARVDTLAVVPILLFAAGHAKRDIPQAVEQAAHTYGVQRTTFAPPLGCDDAMLELSAQRFRDAVSADPNVLCDDTLLVMVGRGSSDAEATAQMHRFAELRRKRTPVRDLSVCFLAMAAPSFDDVMIRAAAAAHARVVVQPHLLFAGELVDRVRERVETLAQTHRETSWVTVQPLGPTGDLAELIAARAADILTKR